jgi:hypothetical protein
MLSIILVEALHRVVCLCVVYIDRMQVFQDFHIYIWKNEADRSTCGRKILSADLLQIFIFSPVQKQKV